MYGQIFEVKKTTSWEGVESAPGRENFFVISLREFKKIFKVHFFLLTLLFTPLFSLLAFEVPSEFGQVSDQFEGTNGRTIVLIEEAHVDYGAQKSIAEILRHLILNDSLRLILVEGGWDDMGLSYLRYYGSPEGRHDVAERYLKEGKISGEEYLQITSDLDFDLWGIEDPGLYRENMEAFLRIHEKNEALLSKARKFEEFLKRLKENIYPPPLLEWERKKQDYEEKRIPFLLYLQFLKNLAQSPNPFEGFPVLSQLARLSGLEGGVDPEKAEWEKQQLIKSLTQKLTKPELKRLGLQEEPKGLHQEIDFLKSLLGGIHKFPAEVKKLSLGHLKRYLEGLEKMAGANAGQTLTDLDLFEQKTVEIFLVNADQKELYSTSQAWGFLKKLFSLELSPDEFSRMKKNPSQFLLSRKISFLEEEARKFSLAPAPTGILKKFEKQTPDAKAFYLSAQRREKALIENAVLKIESENIPLSAVIVGGFHADEMARGLHQKGYSVVVTAPRFTPASDPEAQQKHYFEILKYKWNSSSQKTALLTSAFPKP